MNEDSGGEMSSSMEPQGPRAEEEEMKTHERTEGHVEMKRPPGARARGLLIALAAIARALSWRGPLSLPRTVIATGLLLAVLPLCSARAETVTVHKHGSGTVAFSQGGTPCSNTPDCQVFSAGTSVTLTATPANGTAIWEADCDSVNGNACTLAANADRNPHVYFVNTFTVVLQGAGQGRVLSRSSEINCGPKCSAQIRNNISNFTLTAIPDSSSRLETWGGACAGTTGNECTIAADQARNVQASFALNNLNVSIKGDGWGAVNSSPNGITCGLKCSNHFQNTTVTLTAVPDQHSNFSSWAAACAGTLTTTCTLQSSQVGNVEAHFVPKNLIVLLQGLGTGKVESQTAVGFTCSNSGTPTTSVCSQQIASSSVDVELTATAGSGSTFSRWAGDCHPDAVAATNSQASVNGRVCTVRSDRIRKVRAVFDATTSVPKLAAYTRAGTDPIVAGTDFTVRKVKAFLADHSSVKTVPEFLNRLPVEYLENWIMMPRSESLQTGTAKHPRLIFSDDEAKYVFTVTLAEDDSYPGSHPNVVEFLEWHPGTSNFRMHEIVLPLNVPAMNGVPARTQGVEENDTKCAFCHSTNNVRNDSPFPGTDGLDRKTAWKSKPNWDTYDSWAGMLPFNRDRIYRNSIEHLALNDLLNPWTWRDNPHARRIIEQLPLQPADVLNVPNQPQTEHRSKLSRFQGGAQDGSLVLGTGVNETGQTRTTSYSFDNRPGTGNATSIISAGEFVRLHHTSDVGTAESNDEGRGVNLFDILGGLQGETISANGQNFRAPLNAQRIADDLIQHRTATGDVPNFDVRPIALAILKNCIGTNTTVSNFPTNPQSNPFSSVDLAWTPSAPTRASTVVAFLNARHGISAFNELLFDTYKRQIDLPRRKADLQRLTFDRRAPGDIPDMSKDDWLLKASDTTHGLFQVFDPNVQWEASPSMQTLRAQVFQRSGLAPGDTSQGKKDLSLMSGAGGGIYIDREVYSQTTVKMALFRYFLEPFGVAVDRWAPNVRNRSASYTFADIFRNYETTLRNRLEENLKNNAFGTGGAASDPAAAVSCSTLLDNMNRLFGRGNTPDADDTPTYTDVQRILNRACIACHNDLNLPPVANFAYLAGGSPPRHPSCRFNLAEDTDADGNPTNDKFGPRPTTNCGYNPGTGQTTREERLTRPHYWVGTRTVAVNGTTEADKLRALHNSYLYQRILGHDHPDLRPSNRLLSQRHHTWEHCGTPGGQMPCGGPSLPNSDIQTIRRWILGGRPYTLGDPHIRTIDGTNYDFQAAGEYTYLKDPSFEVQVRHVPHETQKPLGPNSHTGLTSCVTLNGAVAIQTGSHRITYQPDGTSVQGTKRLRIDGQVTPLPTRELPLSNGARIVRTSSGFKVDLPGGTSLEITPFWGDYLSLHFKSTRATEGLGGKISAGEWLPRTRDGRFLGPFPESTDIRYDLLYHDLGESWQVTGENSLFDYEDGTSPETFRVEGWPRGHNPKSCDLPDDHAENHGDPPPAMDPAEAKQACAVLMEAELRIHCEADTAALGDATIAAAYVETEKAMQSWAPRSPELVGPDDFATLAPADVSLRWEESTEDSGDVTYRPCLWNAKTAFIYEICEQPRFANGKLLPGGASGDALWPQDTPKLWAVFVLLLLLALLLLIIAIKRKSLVFAILALLLVLLAIWLVTWTLRTVNGEGLVYQPQALESGETYYWKVLAEDANGGISSSETRTLTLQ